MSESKHGKLVLLDGRIMEFKLTPRLMYEELLKQVAVLLSLKEIEYFGLYCGSENPFWLIPDKKILDQDVFRKSPAVTIYFGVKFFVDSVLMLEDSVTVELFYQQAKQLLLKGIINPDQEKLLELLAFNLQADVGDFKSNDFTRTELYKSDLVSRTFVKSCLSKEKWEDKIISKYIGLKKTSFGHAILKFMNTVERLPTYGVHFYRLKDKRHNTVLLGLSKLGLSIFNQNNINRPTMMFKWKQLENLYYREGKFSVEVNDNSQSSARVYSWFASSGSVAKSVWCMSVAQHQFYLHTQCQRNYSRRHLDEFAAEISSLRGSSSIPVKHLLDHSYLTKLIYAKRTLLERMLTFRLEEAEYLLRKEAFFCQETSEGKSPDSSHSTSGVDVRKPVETDEMTLLLRKLHNSKRTDLQFCFLEHEAQTQIVLCAKDMLLEQAVPQNVIKKRLKFYVQAKEKLEKLAMRKEELEKELKLRAHKRRSVVTSKDLTLDSLLSKNFNENFTQCVQLRRTPSYKWALDKATDKNASQRNRVPCRPKELKTKSYLQCASNWNSLERSKKSDHNFYHIADRVETENTARNEITNETTEKPDDSSQERMTLV